MIIFVIEDSFDLWRDDDTDADHVKQYLTIYNNTQLIKAFNRDIDNYDRNVYPYTNMFETVGVGKVEIRANDDAYMLFTNSSNVNIP